MWILTIHCRIFKINWYCNFLVITLICCNEYFFRVTVMPLTSRNFNHKGKCLLTTNYQGKTIYKQNGCNYGISIYLETASLQINWAAGSIPSHQLIRINLHLLYKPCWLYVYMAVPILQDVCSSDCAIASLMAGIETWRLVALPSCADSANSS